ncbi:hypothetical protein R3P38DRAFT_3170344 [Favolaschia claudopus]|uniref:Uncharacterized protein n=1 Tax=Favolaschia claudopus TaxID=2862362 RepID=A0AAW0DUE6_9AGAR
MTGDVAANAYPASTPRVPRTPGISLRIQSVALPHQKLRVLMCRQPPFIENPWSELCSTLCPCASQYHALDTLPNPGLGIGKSSLVASIHIRKSSGQNFTTEDFDVDLTPGFSYELSSFAGSQVTLTVPSHTLWLCVPRPSGHPYGPPQILATTGPRIGRFGLYPSTLHTPVFFTLLVVPFVTTLSGIQSTSHRLLLSATPHTTPTNVTPRCRVHRGRSPCARSDDLSPCIELRAASFIGLSSQLTLGRLELSSFRCHWVVEFVALEWLLYAG